MKIHGGAHLSTPLQPLFLTEELHMLAQNQVTSKIHMVQTPQHHKKHDDNGCNLTDLCGSVIHPQFKNECTDSLLLWLLAAVF